MRSATSFAILAATSLAVVNGETFRIQVGVNEDGETGNVFFPNQVDAVAGDRIQFEFRAGAHSVTQSSFDEPCTRQFNTVTKALGADSGFQPVEEGADEIPMWEIEIVQDTAPIWMYCNRIPHCNAGMVFAINPPKEGERTFEKFLEKAKEANHPDPEDNITVDFTPPTAPAPDADKPAEGEETTGEETATGEETTTGESTASGSTTATDSAASSSATDSAVSSSATDGAAAPGAEGGEAAATGASSSDTNAAAAPTAPADPNAPAVPENAAANNNSTISAASGASAIRVSAFFSLVALVAGTVMF